MNELGLNPEDVARWFPHERNDPYVLVRVRPEDANAWAAAICNAVRRCYISDERLRARIEELEPELRGTPEERMAAIIASKLPDSGATMAGDFGEILIYLYQAARALPSLAFGAKKWQLKQDRTKPAPCSDVVHFILPTWPTASDRDELLCAEVKLKSTNGDSEPIQDAIRDCNKDRTSRLSRTLQWLKERAMTEPLGQVQIAHLDRFINSIDYPKATKRFRAVAVVSSELLANEITKAPPQASTEYTLVVVSVPTLKAIYEAVFEAAKDSALPELAHP